MSNSVNSIPLNERLLAAQALTEVNRVGPDSNRISPNAPRQDASSFADALKKAQQPKATDPNAALRFSAHAQTRIQSRNIAFGPEERQRMEDAVQKVAGKGGRESLVLLDQNAFVVSVPNRTVITVVDRDSLKQNVFTNIDSAVIA